MVGIILRGLVVISTDQMQLDSGRYTLRSLVSLDLSSSAGHPILLKKKLKNDF